MKRRIISLLSVFALLCGMLFSSVGNTVFAADNKNELFKKDIYNAAIACKESIELTKEPYSSRNYSYTVEQADAICNNAIDEYPELFHILQKTYSVSTQTGKVVAIKFSYKYGKTQYDNMKSAYTEKGMELIADLKNNNLTDLQKALVLHDRIAALCEYDYQNFLNDTVPNDSLNMYGVLVKNVAVCEGYAKTYMWLLSELGIESRLCKSQNVRHVWNIVTIGGKEYHVDVTYDDPVYDTYGGVSHKYFLKSSAYFLSDNEHSTDFDTTPKNTNYDNAFWNVSNSEFCLLDGEIYYVDNDCGKIKNFDGDDLIAVDDRWYAGTGYWKGNYTYLQSGDGLLFFNNSKTVYSYNPKEKILSEIYSPELSEGFGIYGLRAYGGDMYVTVYNSPNFTAQTKHTCTRIFNYRSTLSDITYATITNLKAKTFNENYQTQNVTVKLGTKTLNSGTDYTVSYSNNKWVGTATVTVTGAGEYSGQTSATFKINPANTSITKVTVGTAQATVKWKEHTRQTSGFELQYSTNSSFKNAKTTSVSGNSKTSATLKNLTGGKKYYVRIRIYKYNNGVKYYSAYSKSVTFTPNVSIAQASVSGIKAKTYSGKKLTQSITVTFGGKKLKGGTDYTVAYKNNVNVGKATVTLTGKGKYGGTKTLTFKINPKGTKLKSLVSGKKKITVNWNKQTSQTNGYQVQYSTSSNFKNAVIGTCNNRKATAAVINNLKGGKKYYVRIRTYKNVGNTKYYSAWSSAKSATAGKK